jgi:hypothetical protein
MELETELQTAQGCAPGAAIGVGSVSTIGYHAEQPWTGRGAVRWSRQQERFVGDLAMRDHKMFRSKSLALASLSLILLLLGGSGGLLAAPQQGSSKKEKKDTPKPKGTDAEKPKTNPDTKDGSDASAEPSATNDKAKSTGDGKGEAKPLSIDEEYVRSNLEGFLHPNAIQWLDDGRVKLSFDFTEKNPDHETIFSPKVSSEINSKFRWSVRGEYGWSYTGTGTSSSSKNSDWYYGGLRMGNDGQAYLNCWFTDDLEVDASYVQFVSHNAKQSFGVVFCNELGKAIGANYGTQCATYSNGKISSKKGTIDQVLNEHGLAFKLKVKDGNFEAFRDGRSKAKMEYTKKSYPSGRVGFIWGGGVASIVHRLEIVGRIDAKKMALAIRNAAKK